jgi:DNA invertase Pin-like site-specific DNA recombinase
LYARVSTSDQHPENQLLDLRRYARERGWTVESEYVDKGVSGSRERRPALDRLMEAARKRKVDVVLVWRFDRFARSVRHLVLALEELNALGVAFVSYQENIDTATPMGKAMFTIISAMAELERNVLIERVKSGMARARKDGKHVGRPRMGDADVERMLELKREGLSQREIARRLRVSRAYVSRALARHKGSPRTAS